MTVDRADPTRLKVEWDEVRTHEDRIAEQARGARGADEQRRAPSSAATTSSISCARRSRAPRSPSARTQPNLADLTGGDSVERLERLAALHRSGALTDEEFAAAKARLLG